METKQLLDVWQLGLIGFEMIILLWYFIENIGIKMEKRNTKRRYFSLGALVISCLAVSVSYIVEFVMFSQWPALLFAIVWGGLVVFWAYDFKKLKNIIESEKNLMKIRKELEDTLKEWKSRITF